MRIKGLPIMLALLFTLSGCHAKTQQDAESFFVWMNGYIAQRTNQPYQLLLTYYCEKGYKGGICSEQIAEVWSKDHPNLTILLDGVEEFTTDYSDRYDCYSVCLSVTFDQEGIYYIDNLTFSLGEGETIRLPIGAWTFEVIDGGQDEIHIYNDIVATTSPNVYSFSTSSLPPDTQLKELYYGEDQSVQFLKNSMDTGKIEMEDVNAPLYMVRPKITALVDGVETILLGTQCTCSAMEVDEQDIQRSKEYTYQQLQEMK